MDITVTGSASEPRTSQLFQKAKVLVLGEPEKQRFFFFFFFCEPGNLFTTVIDPISAGDILKVI